MADLKIDLELLQQLKEDLEAIAKEFTVADDLSDSVVEATGHDTLSSHVQNFARKRKDKRKSLTEAVGGL